MARRPRLVVLAIFAIPIWLAATVVSFGYLARYSTTPGPRIDIGLRSLKGFGNLQQNDGLATLIMVGHPRCPCTRATIGELREIMVRSQGKLRALALFIKPEGVEEIWEKTDNWSAAAGIPGVEVAYDEKGMQAKLLGARTSGHVFLFDGTDKLVFSGGITRARGHEGDNPGRTAILSLLNGEKAVRSEAPVFGCALFAD